MEILQKKKLQEEDHMTECYIRIFPGARGKGRPQGMGLQQRSSGKVSFFHPGGSGSVGHSQQEVLGDINRGRKPGSSLRFRKSGGRRSQTGELMSQVERSTSPEEFPIGKKEHGPDFF